jgi:transcriptional regulator of acetoin/glycerol metabolism
LRITPEDARLLSTEERLRQARLVLDHRGTAATDLLPPELLSPEIAASWRRCLAAGLDPHRPPPRVGVSDAALRQCRENLGPLRPLVLAEMEQLFQQIAGTNFMIAFAAPDGLLLDCMTDHSFGPTAQQASIRPGTMWTELACGTNALGTAAQAGAPVTVHGQEHFFASHGDLTCIAAPVFDPHGKLVGVLDASSDCRSRQQHTRALVSMAASQIENGLLRQRHYRDIVIAFHSRAEYLHTLSAGLLAVDTDGHIRAANAQARFLLQGLPVQPGQRFADVFATGFATLLDHAGGGVRRLVDQVGSVFSGQLVCAPPPRSALARGATPAAPPPGFVAADPAVGKAVRQVAAAALRRLPILIRGATGTGKEELARHAHAASLRRGAFVPVNCAALPETLIEAELFGHTEGAYTGARRGGAPGLILQADTGTLFLDEIGEMKPPLQATLLRFLDDYVVRPVGGGKPRQADVLLVAATNVDLEAAVAAGAFRADLFYRLETIHIVLPGLAQRQDFAAIVRHTLGRIDARFTIGAEAIQLLQQREWPGNIRELRSLLTRLVLASASETITLADLATHTRHAARPADDLHGLKRARILAVYGETAGNVAATARRLNVSRNTVYRALREA